MALGFASFIIYPPAPESTPERREEFRAQTDTSYKFPIKNCVFLQRKQKMRNEKMALRDAQSVIPRLRITRRICRKIITQEKFDRIANILREASHALSRARQFYIHFIHEDRDDPSFVSIELIEL